MKTIRNILILALVLVIAFISIHFKTDVPVEALKSKYANGASKFMPLMGMQVHYRDEGNMQDSVPLVLIHGASSSLHTWDSLVVRLKNTKRLIRMDLPAFGLTGPNSSNRYSLDYYALFVDSFLQKLNVDQYIIAGNSLGGGVAWNQHLQYPEKVKKIILIDAIGYPRRNEKGAIGFKLASMPVIGKLMSRITPKFIVRKSLENGYADKTKVTQQMVDRHFDLVLREGNRKALLSIFQNRYDPPYENIKKISVPTLIIWGKHDQLIDVSNALRFQVDIKNSELLILPHSGHVPMEESPNPVAQSILDFINPNQNQP